MTKRDAINGAMSIADDVARSRTAAIAVAQPAPTRRPPPPPNAHRGQPADMPAHRSAHQRQHHCDQIVAEARERLLAVVDAEVVETKEIEHWRAAAGASSPWRVGHRDRRG